MNWALASLCRGAFSSEFVGNALEWNLFKKCTHCKGATVVQGWVCCRVWIGVLQGVDGCTTGFLSLVIFRVTVLLYEHHDNVFSTLGETRASML